AALEMQAFLEEQKQERMRIGKPYFEARIGIHTGSVVAGVVGVKKFAYDIWGDTVNIASRVEAKSEAGRVNISETTYGLIKYHFACEYRGKVEAKNKGMLDMYFVERELTGASVPA
ncbi:MAG: adenylate/guanylate cyclase domain-containing protein, partial [Lewinella sp.]|nr:adenylate/guanylate cyclase domain-containing protein [Lewinella sp.]